MKDTAASVDEQHSMLVSMGFDETKAKQALEISQRNMDKALRYLTHRPVAGGERREGKNAVENWPNKAVSQEAYEHHAQQHDVGKRSSETSETLIQLPEDDIENPPGVEYALIDGFVDLPAPPMISNDLDTLPAPEDDPDNSQLPLEMIPQPSSAAEDTGTKELRRYCFIGLFGIILLGLGIGIAFALVFLLRN